MEFWSLNWTTIYGRVLLIGDRKSSPRGHGMCTGGGNLFLTLFDLKQNVFFTIDPNCVAEVKPN
jgi:hypothetical protein